MKKKLSFVLVLLVVFSMSLTIMAAEFPVIIKDDLDHEVIIEEKPQRIISLAPVNTEILYALDLEDYIVGVTSFANYPEAAKEKEKIGSITEPNIEKIVSLKPDLILAFDINKMESINKLRELGLKVAGFEANTVKEAIVNIKEIGKLTGHNEEASQIVTDMYLKVANIKNLVDKHLKNHKKPKVFYEIWSDPLYTAGKSTFINDLIQLAGGINIGAEAKGEWPQYSLEKLLVENPDVYISTEHSAPGEVNAEKIKERPNFQTIKAFKNDRIYIINQDIVNRASPRLVTGLKLFVKALFPEMIEEVDNI